MLSFNHTFHMFSLPKVKISNVIIELVSYKGKLREHTTPLFSKAKNLKFINFIQMENCIFVNKSESGSLHSLFSQVYLFADDNHHYNTRFASNDVLKIFTNNTSIYGTKKFETSAITSWEFFQSYFTGINLKETCVSQIKHLIKNYFFNFYDNLVT